MLRHGMKSCVLPGWLGLMDRFQMFLDNGFRHHRDSGTEIAQFLIKKGENGERRNLEEFRMFLCEKTSYGQARNVGA